MTMRPWFRSFAFGTSDAENLRSSATADVIVAASVTAITTRILMGALTKRPPRRGYSGPRSKMRGHEGSAERDIVDSAGLLHFLIAYDIGPINLYSLDCCGGTAAAAASESSHP